MTIHKILKGLQHKDLILGKNIRQLAGESHVIFHKNILNFIAMENY